MTHNNSSLFTAVPEPVEGQACYTPQREKHMIWCELMSLRAWGHDPNCKANRDPVTRNKRSNLLDELEVR